MVPGASATLSRSCARRVLCWPAFPLVPVLGSTGSAADRSALFVGFTATPTESDFSGSLHHRLRLLVFPMRTCGIRPQAKPETSRFPYKELPGWAGARNNASVHVAFRETDNVGTRNFQAFAAQWLAYALPYRRFDGTLADAAARLGADVVCYSFIAADFHPLLFAGFYRRTGLLDFCTTGNVCKGGESERHTFRSQRKTLHPN